MFVIAPPARSRRLGDRPPVPPALAAQVRPVSSAASRLLPLSAPLSPLFPGGALQRGSTTLVAALPGHGATTLALSLLATVSTRGGWCAVVGVADPGVVAMAELGVDVHRVVFVSRPRAGWADAAGELLNGVDVVVVHPPRPARLTAARHLVARARERQTALVVMADRVEDWPIGPDVTLTVLSSRWHGAGAGDGHLRRRRAQIQVTGRRAGPRPALRALWLPSETGAVAAAGGELHDGPFVEDRDPAEALATADAGLCGPE